MGENKIIIDDVKAKDIDAVMVAFKEGKLSFYFYKNLLPAIFSREHLIFSLASPKIVLKSIGDKNWCRGIIELNLSGSKAGMNILLIDEKYDEQIKESIGDIILKFLDENQEVKKISIMVLKEEESVNTVLKNLGFKREGRFKQHILVNNKYRDIICWAVFREDFF